MMITHIDDALLESLEPVEERKTYELLSREIRTARLMRLAMRGISCKQAAEIVGCSYQVAWKTFSDPAFKRVVMAKVNSAFEGVDAEIAQREKSLHEEINDAGREAFNVLIETLRQDNAKPELRVKVAQDLLNRNKDAATITTVRTERIASEELILAAQGAAEQDNVLPIRRSA